MLTGSMAMAIYSVPRMTRDIDLVMECRLEDTDRFAELFEIDCYVERKSIRDAITNQSMFNIIHNEWIIKADFIIRKDAPYRSLEFERRRSIDVEGCQVQVVSAEDLILSKLQWAKDAESDLQLKDAGALIKSIKNIDRKYLDKWAASLELSPMLDQVSDQ